MLQNIPKEKILEIVKLGPTFPSKIAKQLGNGADTMLVGAILSTLISTGEIKVSSVKIGGTPLYYVPEQESKLEEFISYLNEKDRATVKLLKEKKVLQDNLQDPLIRFSLRTIKDFAKSFEIEHDNTKIAFWRFYNVSYEDAKELAKDIILAQIKLEEEIKKEKQPETPINAPQEIIVEHVTENLKEESKNKEHTKKEIEKEHKKEKIIKEKDEQDFFEKIKKHVSSKNLDIVSREKVKKTDYNLILKNHNTNEYIYCKAKDKKTISEGDLAPALIFAQNKKMTCLFIATGDLSKKAEIMIHKDFSAMKFEKITN